MDTEPLLGVIYEFVGKTAPGRLQP
jgi:hypothetical protein